MLRALAFVFSLSLVLSSSPLIAGTLEKQAGKKAYVELRVKAHIWANVLHDFDSKGRKLTLSRRQVAKIKEKFPMCEDWEIRQVLTDIRKAERFFLVNSRFNLNLAIDTEVHKDFTLRSEITMGDSPYFTVKEELYKEERELAREGAYDGIIHIERLFRLGDDGELVRVRGGGGFTWGVDDERKFSGISAWAMTPTGHPSTNFWLFTHEFHHQLDRMFELSGHPEYWFNHFAKPEGTAGPFGEHFDGNAWILRTFPEEFYRDLKFGKLKYFTDEDEDGVPDNEPKFALDEKRFGSLATKPDSDGDGLTDLEEVLLWQWAEPGLGEELPLSFVEPNPLDTDADGDGISDGEDLLPLYPVPALIPEKGKGNWLLFAQARDGNLAELRLSYTKDGLFMDLLSQRPIEIKVLLDCGADGWWKEADNIFFVVKPDGSLGRKFVLNGTSEDKWCFEDDSLLKEDSLKIKRNELPQGFLYEIEIKADTAYSFSPEPNRVLGLNVSFRANEEDFYTTFFEPNVLKWLVLGGEDAEESETALRNFLRNAQTFYPPIKPEEKTG